MASGALVWHLVPSEWTLPFWTTLKAAGDAQTYGHPVEHYAEMVVVIVTFAAALGGIACAALTAIGAKVVGRLRHA